MTVLQSEGSLTAVERPMASAWFTPNSITLYAGLVQDYSTIYVTQNAVRVVVDFLARNIAGIGLQTFLRNDDDSRERLRDHPQAKLLDEPNPDLTPYQFLWWTVVDFAVFDQAFWVKVKVEDRIALQPIPPKFMEPIGSNFLRPEGFRLRGNRGYRDLDADQVIHFRGYDPRDPRRGVSRIETLRRILAEDAASGAYRENFWKNGAQATGQINRPVDAPKWTPEDRNEFRQQWQTRFGPMGSDSGGTPILEDGMEYNITSFNAQQSQFIESRKLTREEAASAYGVAPTLVGILDHATFSNIESQHIQNYQDTLGPWLTMIEQTIKQQLTPEFANSEAVYSEFNLAEKLRGDFESETRAFQSAVGGPWMTRAEARAKKNLPVLDGADELIVPMNVTQGGLASPNDTAPPPKTLSLEHQAEVRRFLERQKDVIGRRIIAAQLQGAHVDVNELLNVDRWYAELTTDLDRVGGIR